VEPPMTPMAIGLEGMVAALQSQGHRVLLAHPERSASFHRDPQMLAALVRAGALTSITAGSLVGEFGGPVRRFSQDLLRAGLVHNVVSDAHDHVGRPPGMTAALEQAHLMGLADWLTRAVPSAILAGEEIPPRPGLEGSAAARARLRWRRRRNALGQASR
jgi:protein-tyrosine phosphatase